MPPLARAPQEQLLLLPTAPAGVIATNALARNIYGAVAQELACAALTLHAIPIDGRCTTCFDAERDGQFYEIKSVHHRGKAVLYDWRMAKDAAYPALLYCFVIHRARGARSIEALLAMLRAFLELWVVPSASVRSAAAKCPLRFPQRPSVNPRDGYARAGYNLGYRNVPLHFFQPLNAKLITFNCYGQTFRAILRFQRT